MSQERVIVLIPKFVIRRLRCHCHDVLMRLYSEANIPSMTIVEKANFFETKVDKCCSCECPDRYETTRLQKEDLEGFLRFQMYGLGCKKIFDSAEV